MVVFQNANAICGGGEAGWWVGGGYARSIRHLHFRWRPFLWIAKQNDTNSNIRCVRQEWCAYTCVMRKMLLRKWNTLFHKCGFLKNEIGNRPPHFSRSQLKIKVREHRIPKHSSFVFSLMRIFYESQTKTRFQQTTLILIVIFDMFDKNGMSICVFCESCCSRNENVWGYVNHWTELYLFNDFFRELIINPNTVS